MIIVFLGPPGSGKGTQAQQLCSKKNWSQLSTGDMLRQAIHQKTKLGIQAQEFMSQGILVPDHLVIQMLAEKMEHSDYKNGFILDGFPRNTSQALALDRMLEQKGQAVDQVILFKISDADLVRRLSGRRTCVQCGAMYHLDFSPPLRNEICNHCGNTLIQRDDDKPEVIKNRLAVYHTQTEPLVDWYRGQGKLAEIGAQMPAQDVTAALFRILE